MKTMGERIRHLRKEKKLTLVDLAGKQMTKGMLSLIENNKATPSMENLTYLAEQLQVPIAELLGDQIDQEKQLLQKIEHLVKQDASFKKNADKVWELYDDAKPLSNQLSGARLAVFFGRSAYYQGEAIAPFFIHAEKVYLGLHATDLWVDTVITRAEFFLEERKYEEALAYFTLKYEEMKTLEVEPTPMRMLKWNFYLAVFQFALGQYTKGMETIDESMALSKSHHLYYMMNQLLRMATAVEMMTSGEDYERKYLIKLKQYAAFSEDEDLHVYIPFIEAHYYTTFVPHAKQAKELLQQVSLENTADFYHPFLYLEQGKVYFIEENYDDALQSFAAVKTLDVLEHPIDQSVLASKFTYQAKIALKTANTELLSEALTLGKAAFSSLPASFYKDEFCKVAQTITSHNNRNN